MAPRSSWRLTVWKQQHDQSQHRWALNLNTFELFNYADCHQTKWIVARDVSYKDMVWYMWQYDVCWWCLVILHLFTGTHVDVMFWFLSNARIRPHKNGPIIAWPRLSAEFRNHQWVSGWQLIILRHIVIRYDVIYHIWWQPTTLDVTTVRLAFFCFCDVDQQEHHVQQNAVSGRAAAFVNMAKWKRCNSRTVKPRNSSLSCDQTPLFVLIFRQVTMRTKSTMTASTVPPAPNKLVLFIPHYFK